jgi:AcrR family transcriptional regulator
VQDHRKKIIDTGLTILREQGLAGLTQPRIAAMTGLRQSHLTYYYPTRADLLTAVTRAAIEAQLAGARSLTNGIVSAKQAAARMATVAARRENTRVLAALNQAADQEPTVRALFTELLDGFIGELGMLLERLKLLPTAARIDLLHALFVGLSIIDLATHRKNGRARAKAVLSLTFDLLSGEKRDQNSHVRYRARTTASQRPANHRPRLPEPFPADARHDTGRRRTGTHARRN